MSGGKLPVGSHQVMTLCLIMVGTATAPFVSEHYLLGLSIAAYREESKNNHEDDRHSGDTWVKKSTIYNKLSGPIAEGDVKKMNMYY